MEMQERKYRAEDSVSDSVKWVFKGPGRGTSDSISATPDCGR